MTKRPGARVHGPNCQSNNLFGEEERSAQRKYDRRVEVASRRGCLIIESRAIVRIVVLRNLCQRSLLCHFLCHHVNHCHFMDIFFCVVTDAPTSTRPLPPFRGSLIMGYNTKRRLYETSSVRRQLARDVQFFFRRVGGWGSSRDLCRRPDMSVIRWSLGLSRVWIISRYVFLSVRGMTNWKVNEARSSYVIVYCTTEGPDYSSTFGSTEVGGREVSMTVIIIY